MRILKVKKDEKPQKMVGEGCKTERALWENWGKEDGYVQNTWYERKLGS